MKSLMNVNLYLKMFSFYVLSACIKHKVVDINIQSFFPRPKFDVLEFLSVDLRPYFQVVPNGQRDFETLKCCSNWTSQFSPFMKKMESCLFFFSKKGLGCTSKFFPVY